MMEYMAPLPELTEQQKEILRWIVGQVRNGKLQEEFTLESRDETRYYFHRELQLPAVVPVLTRRMLDVFAARDLMLVEEPIKHERNLLFTTYESVRCSLTENAYRAVDANFSDATSLPGSGTGEAPDHAIFGAPIEKYRYNLFVLMPFLPELQPVYEDHIRKVARALSLTIARGDDFFSQNAIIQEIWSAIVQADILIADCTGKNANVFYEIGIAHALDKPVILVTQNTEDVPFDLRHRRYIKYDPTPQGLVQLEKQLSATILETRKDRDKPA